MKLFPLLLLVFHSPAVAQGRLWIVDDDGGAGVDFLSISAAVSAANDGDAILLHAGSYVEDDVLVEKQLSIFARGDGELGISAEFLVATPEPDQHVVLRGLVRRAQEEGDSLQVRVAGEGLGWIENCLLGTETFPILPFIPTSGVACVSDCVVLRCSIRGADEIFASQITYGLRVSGGTVLGTPTMFAYGCDVQAGVTQPPAPTFVQCEAYGSGAIQAWFDSRAYLIDTTGVGGPAGPGGDGGVGLYVANESTLHAVNSSFVGGPGGPDLNGCGEGQPGDDVYTEFSGELAEHSFTTPRLSTPCPIDVGATAEIDVAAQPGDLFVVYGSRDYTWPEPGAELRWPQFVADPLAFLGSSKVPQSGEATIPLTVAALPDGVEFFELWVQGAALSPMGRAQLSYPSVTFVVP